ncbi:MAG TPA: hypothetical protein VEH49_05620 [Methylomirabilota bacterium]|nr:hypothetical protein [Methylomirabilota bacterium]
MPPLLVYFSLMYDEASARERARVAEGDELTELLHHQASGVLLALLENPVLDETRLCLLLERKDLPGEIVEAVARRRPLMKNYRVKRGIAFHPHAPRLVALRLLRDLYLMDLSQLALSPTVVPELKRQAEEHLLARLPQLPLGQKIALARRGPGRVAGALLAEGHTQVVAVALDNANLSESQLLKALWTPKLPERVLTALANHRKWSFNYNIRIAMVRHPRSPLAVVLAILPELTLSDLRQLAAPGIVSESLSNYLRAEVARRTHASRSPLAGDTES